MDKRSEAPQGVTRFVQTDAGLIAYSDLSDIIAPRLEALLDRVVGGAYHNQRFCEDLLREFHREIVGYVLPAIAGEWRKMSVQVGHHIPPPHFYVPARMKDFVDNVQERLSHASTTELQIELLAYAEGELLHIHPFVDFNGRTSRAMLMDLLTRMDLPAVSVPVKRDTDEFSRYRRALAAYDNGQIGPLVHFWEARFAQFDAR